ncbi:MAG: hypothetical protein NT069_03245 [Planctomycetota bacterium]|nr:hypothetical protein [Planctomycetota bacterium]
MLGRFLCALLLVVIIAITGTRLEKQNRELSRQISLQHRRAQVLKREYAQVRLRAQRLGAPARILDQVESTDSPPAELKPGSSR